MLAAAVAGLGHEEAADAADALRGARILTGTPTASGRLEFTHPLIATAVYRAIPAGVRVALHGQAAWCVINEGQGPSAAARHLMETHPDGDNWVVQQLRAAAGETLRAGAPDTARTYLARALREPPPFDDRAAVLYELGSASLLTEPATTVNHLRAALEEPISDAGLRQNIVYRLSQVLAHSDRLAEASETLAREIRVTDDARVKLGACACSPSSSCGTPSAPTNPTTPRAPAASPNSPTGSRAATSPSGTSSACAPGTPYSVVNPHMWPCTTPSAR